MKKPPAIYGIGWIQAPATSSGTAISSSTAAASGDALTSTGTLTPSDTLTLSYIGTAEEKAAVGLAAAVGHPMGTDGSYALAPDRLAAIPAGDIPDGEVADLLADMVEDELDIVVVFAAGGTTSAAGGTTGAAGGTTGAVGGTTGAAGGTAVQDPLVRLLREVDDSGRAEVVYGEAHWWPTEDAATDPYPLIERWATVWPDSLPIAHELKELFEDQWVRLHSLPGSKRAPETDADWSVALGRHNAVLGDLTAGDLAAGDPAAGAPAAIDGDLLVIMSVVAPTPAPADEDADFWTSVAWHYADPDLLFAHLYVTAEQWAPGALDELLRLAIEQQIGGVIIAPLDLAWLYHPYPGGADVIVANPSCRSRLATRYADWRSSHPSGL